MHGITNLAGIVIKRLHNIIESTNHDFLIDGKHRNLIHGSAMEGYYYPHELILGYEICQMKGTLIGV